MGLQSAPPTESWGLNDILKTMVPLLTVMALVGIAAGSVLETFAEDFITNPALVVMIPVVIGMGGNLGSILASSISTGLHTGRTEPTFTDKYVISHSIAVIALATTISAATGILAHLIGNTLGGGTLALTKTLQIAMASGLTLSLFVIIFGVGATILPYRHGINPDDTALPVVTTACDILGVLILTGYVLLLV